MYIIKQLPYYLRKLLEGKTQVISNTNLFDNDNKLSKAHEQTIHTRGSHSESVSNIALKLFQKLPQYQFLSNEEQQKYSQSLYYTSMLHDIGQPSYGHALANLTNDVINQHFPHLFFDDNSNNIVFLEMYNLKRTLKTLNINYEKNIKAINKIIFETKEDMYYKRLINLTKYKPFKEITQKEIETFKKELKEENEGILLDKNLLCYLIKYPYCLDNEKKVTKGLYPTIHNKYISHFFKLKRQEQIKGLEVNKKQLMCTWFMDMADEIAYINGDFSNFLNLYYNDPNFKKGIIEFYPKTEYEIKKTIKLILKECSFPFKKKINETSDFNVIENKLIDYFIKNINIDENIKSSNIKELFSNKKTLELFNQIKLINYDIYIDFTEENFNLNYNNKKESVFRSKEFLNKIYKQLKRERTIPNYIVDNIKSDLYKELIKYNLKEGNVETVALFYTNYLMEIPIDKFNSTIEMFFQRNPMKNEKTQNQIINNYKQVKKEHKFGLKQEVK